jgi:predicted regulator of Ras-like GTPase activity (Roadblock/LC7/MglB family)
MARQEQFLEIVQDLKSANPEIDGVALVSSDGRIVDHVWNGGVEPDKIGAVGAAMLGLGKKAIQVISNGDFLQVVLQSTGGMLAIYSAGDRAVLLVSTGRNGNLGLLNLYCRDAAIRLGGLVEEE